MSVRRTFAFALGGLSGFALAAAAGASARFCAGRRCVDRAEMLFDEPIYGLVGGLHFPVTASREQLFGLLPAQRLMGTGKPPWDPINWQDVETAIAYLERCQPGLVSLSPHDSCDWSLDAFRTAFGQAYQDLLVGKEIVVQ